MTDLLDANVLIALTVADHVHHDVAERWFVGATDSFATCPVTQGALLRAWLRAGATSADAVAVLAAVTASERHEFWSDDQSYLDVELRGVVGHRQVTDAYLAGLARARGGRLVTLDRALTALHPDVAVALAD
ncbi:MAG: PIN domain-containing protein [Frankiaceae bacterium]|nr:PIN domain-containing protein [Frankiaceae bacterium]